MWASTNLTGSTGGLHEMNTTARDQSRILVMANLAGTDRGLTAGGVCQTIFYPMINLCGLLVMIPSNLPNRLSRRGRLMEVTSLAICCSRVSSLSSSSSLLAGLEWSSGGQNSSESYSRIVQYEARQYMTVRITDSKRS
jgi:hypothetical protein